MSSISTRKKDHVELTMSQSSQYIRTTGLDSIQLRHNALPECSIDDIDTSAQLLGKDILITAIYLIYDGGL